MKKICQYTFTLLVAFTIIGPSVQAQLVSTSEQTLDFGNIAIGNSAIDIVTITNTSNEDINISAHVTGDASFSTTFSGFSAISPSFSVDIEVQFQPTANGDATGTLVVDVLGSASGSEQVTVDLIGTGGAPTNPCEMVDDILDFFDESIANGTLESTGNHPNNRRQRALRNRIRAVAFLCNHGYYQHAAYIAQTAIWRTDGENCPKDFVQGVNRDALHDQLVQLHLLLE